MLTNLIALLGAGVVSFLAPCIVPLLPAYLGMIVGETADAHDPAKAVPATAVFVLGFALVFAALGAAAGYVGSSLHSLQHVVQVVGGVVIVIMGLVMLGALRGPFMRERRLLTRVPLPRSGVARPLVMGVAFGAAWSPCVGPLLGAALTVAARSGQAGRGALLLLAYAAGIGIPFMLAALGFAAAPGVTRQLQRAGARIERVAGALLVVLGLLLATGLYAHLASYLVSLSPSVSR
jgi:cytochrome c-type biogenesis protein